MYLYLLTALFAGLMYGLDGHTIVAHAVVSRYRRFRELNKLVGTQYKTVGLIIWVSCAMIVKMMWLNFLHWAFSHIEHTDKQHAILSYVLNGRLYRLVLPIRRGPSPVLLITDENGDDVTDQILPFLGPNEDWHGQTFTPAFWQKESLTFELSDGSDSLAFTKNQPVVLSVQN